VACAPGDPYGVDGEAILATLFPRGHPYSWPVIGSMDDLNKATLDHLKVLFTEYYHPPNVMKQLHRGKGGAVSVACAIREQLEPG